MQELKSMILQLDSEGIEETIKMLENPPNPGKELLFNLYDNITDAARRKLIAYAKDLWHNPVTHRCLKNGQSQVKIICLPRRPKGRYASHRVS